MEKNLAILIADLSGYTALTEAHGAISAADLIERFLQIVRNSLVSDSHLHQRRGDEVMIVSESPDNLLSTALLLLKNSVTENNFLLLHGGLHYGPVLKRDGEYFGSVINSTSRIASKANAGSFWCSKEFRDAVQNEKLCEFEAMGTHELKNVPEEKEIFRIVNENTSLLGIDPVCRMLILSAQKAIPHPIEKEVFFCSENCLSIYEANKKKKTSTELLSP
ncbi:MAG TPA: adenylate/guanylate cyclase domain-containing protein [Chitinophagaceae bacterium]|nr:adenylate/guanylate cyclase domain-containing protein [Chitinophagaceae bacterium]